MLFIAYQPDGLTYLPTTNMQNEVATTKSRYLYIFNFIQYRKPVVDNRNLSLVVVVIKILIKISYPK